MGGSNMKTFSDYVDDATHAAINALGLSAENVPEFTDMLNDFLTEHAVHYVTDDEPMPEEDPT